ncbi:MAG: hypothetical protein KDB25_08465, partial [Leucobacter sp.]|nr:hypothetical protein [Leucobacter sp.]
MPPTITRIDPELPLCWEDESTLRFGFDEARLRISRPSVVTQRLIGALQGGVRSDRVGATLERIGATRRCWNETVELLEPILHRLPAGAAASAGSAVRAVPDVPERGDSAAFAVGIEAPAGAHAVAEVFGRACIRAGFAITRTDPCLTISIERFVAPLERPVRPASWGAPRLLIRFADRSIGIGPLLSAADDPCPSCIVLADVDADPALPAIAAQLIGVTPASETGAGAEAAAALAT